MKHTELPWKIYDWKNWDQAEIQNKENDVICKFPHLLPNWLNDAQFIVRACNSHYELLEACKFAKSVIQFGESWIDKCEEVISQAIAKAEGKE